MKATTRKINLFLVVFLNNIFRQMISNFRKSLKNSTEIPEHIWNNDIARGLKTNRVYWI
jgi:hypothetical protein